MNKILYLLFLSLFFSDFLHFDVQALPRSTTWLPEALAIVTLTLVAIILAVRKQFALSNRYVYLIVMFLSVTLMGILLNATPPGTIFVGLRTYFKTLPFFLLPAVYDFSEKQLRHQLLLLLPLLLLQCPLAIYQRLFQFKGLLTGDVISGTLQISSALSITMIGGIAVLFGFYLTKRIGLSFFAITAFLLFLPTTLNETKGTLVLLPIALLLPAFLSQTHERSKTLRTFCTMVSLVIVLIAVFVPIYDHFMRPRWGYGLLDFFSSQERIESYFYKGSEGMPGDKMGRADSILLAHKHLSKDIGTLAFGLGMGNITGSYFGSFKGEHVDKKSYGGTILTLTQFLWEFGVLGVIIYIAFFIFFLLDTLLLRKSNDIFGAFSLGWVAVIVMLGLSLVYKNILNFSAINFLFWYFSGLVAAKAFQFRKQKTSVAI